MTTVTHTRLQHEVTANGDGQALQVSGFATFSFQVTGTFVATVHFEGSVNGRDYFPISAEPFSGGAAVSSTSTVGLYRVREGAGLFTVRARGGSYTSGAVSVDILATETVVGIPGPQGATGPAGSGSAYTHNQVAPASTWVVVHNLGYKPGGIHVEDSAGSEVEGEITHDSTNQVTLLFSGSFSGVAYLS